MKKIINGKMYNTDTAKFLGEFYSCSGINDFNYIHESLYVTQKGQYFIDGKGGPNTCYAKYHDCHTIMLLTVGEAKEWAETFLNADEYLKAFGEVEEG